MVQVFFNTCADRVFWFKPQFFFSELHVTLSVILVATLVGIIDVLWGDLGVIEFVDVSNNVIETGRFASAAIKDAGLS